MLRSLRSSYWRAVAATKCRASLLMMAQAHKFVAMAEREACQRHEGQRNEQKPAAIKSRSGFSYKVGLPESDKRRLLHVRAYEPRRETAVATLQSDGRRPRARA